MPEKDIEAESSVEERTPDDLEVKRCRWICRKIIEDGHYKYLVCQLKFLEAEEDMKEYSHIAAHVSLANRLFRALERDDYDTQRRWSCCVGLPLLLRDDAERVSRLLAERRGGGGKEEKEAKTGGGEEAGG